MLRFALSAEKSARKPTWPCMAVLLVIPVSTAMYCVASVSKKIDA